MFCVISESTPFLCSVAQSMKSRMLYLPNKCNVTQVLRCWQMSVRQATGPTGQLTSVAAASTILGHA